MAVINEKPLILNLEDVKFYPTGSHVKFIFKSNEYFDNNNYNTKLDENIANSEFNTIKIEYVRKFVQQFQIQRKYFSNHNVKEASIKFQNLLFKVLKLKHNSLEFQLSFDESILYTLKKDNFTFYFEQFLNITEVDDFEYTITGFEEDKKLKSTSGDLDEILNFIKSNTEYYINLKAV